MDKLVLIGLQKEFKRKKVIDNINLTLSNGVYGLLGENAAGKTTLMRLICGLLKESEGEITYNGVNIHYLGTSSVNSLRLVASVVTLVTESKRV